MSEIKVNSIKGVNSTDAAITINNSDGTCTANLTNKPNRNLIINGAMQVAQRGTSSTSSGIQTVDRFSFHSGGTDEAPTQSQSDVTSGTTPYTLGFRKSYKVTNGNQTSGAGSSDYTWIQMKLESQDIANSGWNYLSSSSNITLSFWVKSSVAQDFKGYLKTQDGTKRSYAFATGSLAADTWTKVTKTIPGNSGLQFDNNIDEGFEFNILTFMGTDFTNNSVTEDAWVTYSGSARMKDHTSTWYTTNDATFEITGVQLEVSDHATSFEHRSFAQELALCQRYYYRHAEGAVDRIVGTGCIYNSSINIGYIQFPCQMRAIPSMDAPSGTNYYKVVSNNSTQYQPNCTQEDTNINCSGFRFSGGTSTTTGHGAYFRLGSASAYVAFQAEL